MTGAIMSKIQRDSFWDLTAFCAGARARTMGIDLKYNPFMRSSLYYHSSWYFGWRSIEI